MKQKSVLFVLLCLLSFSLFAQSNQGRITLSGGIGYESSNEKTDPSSSEDDMSSLSLMPQFGYYISDAIKLGIGIGYMMSSTEHTPATGAGNPRSTESSMIAINPFARFYVSASEKVDLFLQANLVFGTGSYEQEFGNPAPAPPTISKGDISSLDIFLAPGIEFMISQKISLDFSVGEIGYFSSKVSPDVTPKAEFLTSGFKFNFDLSRVALGINIFLN